MPGYMHWDRPLHDKEDDRNKFGFHFKKGDMDPSWHALDRVNVIVFHSWTSSMHYIDHVNVTDNSVHFTNPSAWPIGHFKNPEGQRYYVENLLEALDAPGMLV